MTTITRAIRAVFVGDAPPEPVMPIVLPATVAVFVVLNLIAMVMG